MFEDLAAPMRGRDSTMDAVNQLGGFVVATLEDYERDEHPYRDQNEPIQGDRPRMPRSRQVEGVTQWRVRHPSDIGPSTELPRHEQPLSNGVEGETEGDHDHTTLRAVERLEFHATSLSW
jgi:hypothetical protein